MTFNVIWKRTNPVSRFIFALLVLYAVIAVFFLFNTLGIVNIFPNARDNPLASEYVSASFGILSFVFIVFISVFHLSTMIRRRKRHADRIADGRHRQ